MSPHRATVVLALTGTGIAAVRDVAAALPQPVFGIDDDRSRPGHYSRLLRRAPDLQRRALDEGLVSALRAFAERESLRPTLVPCSDPACAWVVTHHAALSAFADVSAGYTDEAAGMLLDKFRFDERCQALGIDVPRSAMPETEADIDAFLRDVGTPCIVKPRAGHLWRDKLRGRKLLVAPDGDTLRRWLGEIIGDPRAVVLQELIPGPESELVVGATLFAQDGTPRHVLTGRKIRQFPRDFGSGSLVVTEDLPTIRALSERVVGELGYRGICGTEFKRDPRSGRYRLIEINPRPTLWFDLCRAAGTHLIAAHVAELQGQAPLRIASQRDGVTWRYWTRDVIAVAQASADPAGALRAWLSSPPSDTLATMSGDDPLMSAATLAHTARQAFDHLRRR